MDIYFEEISEVHLYKNILMVSFRRSEDMDAWDTFYLNKDTGKFVTIHTSFNTEKRFIRLSDEFQNELLSILNNAENIVNIGDGAYKFDSAFRDRIDSVFKVTAEDAEELKFLF
ncbi:hypothetical protein [Bacillus toyonensis]|uniref:hypothetical protein n=1 Tax=Bacillus toyonensis TaxID=155322 RepID=UPI002E225257|nr:hypothetical protein [Bacillus toyonensis]